MQEPDLDEPKVGIDPLWVFAIIRDMAVLVGFSYVSLFANVFLFKKILHAQPDQFYFVAYFALLIVLMVVGCTVSACLTRINRWLHLFCVAIGIWVIDALGCFILHVLDVNFGQYLAVRVLVIVLPMLLGGTLSYVFKKTPKSNG